MDITEVTNIEGRISHVAISRTRSILTHSHKSACKLTKNRAKRGALLELPSRIEQLAWHTPTSAKTKKKRAIYVKVNARLLHLQEQNLRTDATPIKITQRNSQKKPGSTARTTAAAATNTKHTKPTAKRTVTLKPIVISSDETELESRENSSEAMSDSSSDIEVKTICGPKAGDVLDHEIKKRQRRRTGLTDASRPN